MRRQRLVINPCDGLGMEEKAELMQNLTTVFMVSRDVPMIEEHRLPSGIFW